MEETVVDGGTKITNSCPLCKSAFSIVYKSVDGFLCNEYQLIAQKKQEKEDTVLDEEVVFCEVCGSAEDEDVLLLCDQCDRGFHTYCLNIAHVPLLAEWFCAECVRGKSLKVRREQVAAMAQARWMDLDEPQSHCFLLVQILLIYCRRINFLAATK